MSDTCEYLKNAFPQQTSTATKIQ